MIFQILQCAFCILVVMGVSYGLGAHVDNVPQVNRPKALIFKWAGQVAYIVVSTLVKFVVGIFLLRLCVNNNWQRLTIIILLVIVGLFNIFYVFLAIFQCQPVEYYWYRYDPDAPVTGKCNGHALATIPTYFAVLIGIVSDLVLALLPATLIKGANLDKRTKISVCCVLALGSLYVFPSVHSHSPPLPPSLFRHHLPAPGDNHMGPLHSFVSCHASAGRNFLCSSFFISPLGLKVAYLIVHLVIPSLSLGPPLRRLLASRMPNSCSATLTTSTTLPIWQYGVLSNVASPSRRPRWPPSGPSSSR